MRRPQSPIASTRFSSGETVLVAALGLSPAVLTETLWALGHAEVSVVPDRIIVLTTRTGRARIEEVLFSDGQWKTFLAILAERLARPEILELRFGLSSESIRVIPAADGSEDLDDIRSQADNDGMAEFILEVLRSITADEDSTVLASIAGGRKTMGALLHAAMTLTGRAQDRILHIIVDEPWDRFHDFLYPGCLGEFRDPSTGKLLTSTDARLHLAEVPFVPLRYLFARELGRSSGKFLPLMQRLRAQANSVKPVHQITIDPKRGTLHIDDSAIALSPREFVFYLSFIERAKEGLPQLPSYQDLSAEAFQSLALRHQALQDLGHWSHSVIEADWDLSQDGKQLAHSIRKKLEKAGFPPLSTAILVPERSRLAIDLPPSAIHFR